MIELTATYALKNWKEQERPARLRTETTLTFEVSEVVIRYCVWSVLGGSFIVGWIVVKRKLGGNIWGGGMFRVLQKL